MSWLAARLENAIQILGQGFIAHPANTGLRRSLKGPLDAREYYRQLAYVAYRLVFLFLAEHRGVLHAPNASEAARACYEHTCSVRRLRDLARVGPHDTTGSEHWHCLGRVFKALAEGDAGLGLPPLDGSFWSPASTPHLLAPGYAQGALKHVELSDTHLLHVIFAIMESSDDSSRPSQVRPLHQELGAAFESLLALQPHVDLAARNERDRFTLSAAANHARKTSGSYYTPDALVQRMLDSALEPVVDEATRGLGREQAEQAILALKVCDPACGAGYFLIAAARRLALRLAQVRACRDDPRAETVQQALRDVVRRCIYGVDLNPLAADLCKVNLWFECGEPGMPLSLLDTHIKCGNALVGATQELMAAGIPDEAFVVRPGDDRKSVAFYKARNKQERKRSPNTTVAPSDANAQKPRDIARATADAWCAAFVWNRHCIGSSAEDEDSRRSAITEKLYRDIEKDPHSVEPWVLDEIARLALLFRFFHWELEFPEVFGRPHSGFDVILGNPPFLNQLESATATTRGPDAITRLRTAGVIRGYTDVSATFLVVAARLTAKGGRLSLVQPQSLLAVKDAAPIRRAVLEHASLEMLWVSNEHVFEEAGIYTCALTLQVGGPRRTQLQRLATGAFTELPCVQVDNDLLAQSETWSHLVAAASGIPEIRVNDARTLADIAHATADFRDQYYGLEGFIVEHNSLSPQQRDQWDDFPPILTSGLIDLCQCHWGKVPIRILKAKWEAPRIDRKRMDTHGSLGPWITTRLIPKVLVAAQTRIIEVLTDVDGRFVPSVPLITLTPKDPSQLWRLAAAIASPVCSAVAMQRYAGSAMNADAIKLSAAQVLRMPLPTNETAWNQAAEHLQAVHGEPDARQAALHSFALASCEAYAISEPAPLVRWWLDRQAPRARTRRQVATPDNDPQPLPEEALGIERA